MLWRFDGYYHWLPWGFSLNESRYPNICIQLKPWFFYTALSPKLRYPQWEGKV